MKTKTKLKAEDIGEHGIIAGCRCQPCKSGDRQEPTLIIAAISKGYEITRTSGPNAYFPMICKKA